MRRTVAMLLIVVMTMVMLGCSAHAHKVGAGAQGSDIQTARQWYVLWGIIPINEIDTNTMAGPVNDYEVRTEQSAVDFIISMFTGIVTVNCRTVTVTK
jgi:hypothetical protein